MTESLAAPEKGTEPQGLRLGTSDHSAAAAIQARIADMAEQLFRQIGYQKTTVGDIAEELQMSPANVYRFFASKAAICETVVRRLAAEMRDRIHEATSQPGLSATERLRLLVTLTHDEVANRCISDKKMHAMVHAAVEQNWNVVFEHQEALRQITAEIIADGVRSGEFDVDDVETASHCFQAAMTSCCHPLILENRLNAGEDVGQFVEPMLTFALKGLGVAAGTNHPTPGHN